MPTKDEVIEKFYKRWEEGAQRLYKRIKDDPAYNTMGITVKNITEWIQRSHLTVKPKFYYKGKFNSFVAPEPMHTFQVDLFNFNYEQKVNFPDNPPPPHGLIAVDVFTKKVHVVPLESKDGPSWMKAMDEIINKMGKPKAIMTDPDASVLGNEMQEWFRRMKKRGADIQHTLTRHHASFAERSLRMFKYLMYKKVKKDVRPWTEYLSAVLEQMNTGRMPIDPNNRERGDEKTFPRNSTGFTPEDAAKPENWFEARNNMEIQSKHNRKYKSIYVGDKVKVWRQKSILEKENVSDFPDDPVEVQKIVRSLGQTRYVVENKSIPVLRSDLWLHRAGPRKDAKPGKLDKPEPFKQAEPYMSYKLRRIRQREDNKTKREENRAAKATAKAKAKVDKVETTRKRQEEAKKRREEAKARAIEARKFEASIRSALKFRRAKK